MNWGGPEFVLVIIALSTGGWLLNNWIRARHGYALEDEWFGKTERSDPEAAHEAQVLNAKLLERVTKLEQRTAALETIVTDSGYNVARQIEALSPLEATRSPSATPPPTAHAR
ncbi:hypothetical protein [Novosphingobium sp. BW1]|uniref:hypothetical protein n=1 Tax=Novosphingobium sp. BW1 TaxID=2592621 RepID=UPI0011DE7424|nr:hypothetical protein [Novosphingobium sp. BW1]TYC91860.1 hypothetical protein FMM79_04230 [Novosphingobium sp. BW1]